MTKQLYQACPLHEATEVRTSLNDAMESKVVYVSYVVTATVGGELANSMILARVYTRLSIYSCCESTSSGAASEHAVN